MVLVIVTIVIAGLATFVYFSMRSSRATAAVGPVPLAGRMKVRPYSDVSPVAAPREAPVAREPAVPPAAAPLFDIDLEPVVVPPPPLEIRWSRQFDSRSATLDETARLRLIGDLGVIAKEWCVPLLSQAYEEERRPGHRQAALIALAACRSRAASPTFERALSSADAGERAIAADGLADLEPPPKTKARRTVERRS